MTTDKVDSTPLTEASPSVHTHLTILQGVVQRMAANSASCKTWCITLVAAVLVVVADRGKPGLFWLALLPVPVFALLDVYYLALEKGFRDSYAMFVRRLHSGILTPDDLYEIAPSKNHAWLSAEAFASYSIVGFYLPLAAMAVLVKYLVV